MLSSLFIQAKANITMALKDVSSKNLLSNLTESVVPP